MAGQVGALVPAGDDVLDAGTVVLTDGDHGLAGQEYGDPAVRQFRTARAGPEALCAKLGR